MRKVACFIVTLVFVFSFSSFTEKNAGPSVGLNKGSQIPEIKTTGDTKNLLNTHQGKLVLINFWASYDASSRINNIQLCKFSENYINNSGSNENKLSVISVSLDNYQSVFEETVKRDGIESAVNVCETNGLESELSRSFALKKNGLGNFLVDENGIILAKNLNKEKLQEILEKYGNG